VPSSIALVFIAAVIAKVAWGRITADPALRNTPPHPPRLAAVQSFHFYTHFLLRVSEPCFTRNTQSSEVCSQ
jgi:hypothetical protein